MSASTVQSPHRSSLDVDGFREHFPGLAGRVHGRPLVYLDNAATSQRAKEAIEAVRLMQTELCANVHRGVHERSAQASARFEAVREIVRRFIGAASEREIIFTRGTTEAINLVAQSWGRRNVGPGDEVLITHLEHHSNIVPWQMLTEEKGATLRVLPVDDRGQLRMDLLDAHLSRATKLVAVNHVSNALGTINPVDELVRAAHAVGARVLVDGAQAASHLPVDVSAMDADFYAFSAHKVYGPTGVGALYGKLDLLESMPPWQGGGDMIKEVRLDRSVYNDVPYRFEAGTPNIEGVVGMGAALELVESFGIESLGAHEDTLLALATSAITEIPGVRIVGTAERKASVLSFLIDGFHAHDLGTLLDGQGVAIRTGHHCAMPVMERFGTTATARASFAAYNTMSEVETFIRATHKALAMLR